MAVTVTRFVVCEHATRTAPHTLRRVRRSWKEPPSSFGIYIEFQRQNEQREFAWRIRIWRGNRPLGETVEELELGGRKFVECVNNVALQSAEPKTYRLEVLIDGVPQASTMIDFGDTEAHR